MSKKPYYGDVFTPLLGCHEVDGSVYPIEAKFQIWALNQQIAEWLCQIMKYEYEDLFKTEYNSVWDEGMPPVSSRCPEIFN